MNNINFIGTDKTVKFIGYDQNLTIKFKNMIQKSSNIKERLVTAIIASIENKVTKCYHFKGIDNDIMITYMVGIADWKLISFAKTSEGYGFPRGFPILWSLDSMKFIDYAGFLPKFDNDDRKEELFSLDSIDKMIITKKFSGSLGLLTAFNYNDQIYIYTGAKNSTGNIYSTELYNLLNKLYENNENKYLELINYLLNGHVMAFEICSKNSDLGHHADIYYNSLLVGLVIGDKTDNNIIIKFIDDIKAMELFKYFNIPVEDRYIVKDIMGFENELKKIHRMRDYIDNKTFDNIMLNAKHKKLIEIVKGNVNHSYISEVLEGLVIFTNINTKKFKFARYTSITMCISTLMIKGFLNNIDTFIENKSKIMASIESYISKWIISKSTQVSYKKYLFEICIRLVYDNTSNYTTYNYLQFLLPIIDDTLLCKYDENIYNWIGDNYKIIILIGHIGSGKTLLRQKLQNKYNIISLGSDDIIFNEYNSQLKREELFGTIVKKLIQFGKGMPIIIEDNGSILWNKNTHLSDFSDKINELISGMCDVVGILAPESFINYNSNKNNNYMTEITNIIPDVVDFKIKSSNIILKSNARGYNIYQNKKQAIKILTNKTKYSIAIQQNIITWGEDMSIPIIGYELVNNDIKCNNFDFITKDIYNSIPNSIDCEYTRFTYGVKVLIANFNNIKFIGHIKFAENKTFGEVMLFENNFNLEKYCNTIGKIIEIKCLTQNKNKKKKKSRTFRMVIFPDIKFQYCESIPYLSINAPFDNNHCQDIANKFIKYEENEVIINVDENEYFIELTNNDIKVNFNMIYSYAN